MKLPFYSVAVIAMCLLLACKSNNDNLKNTADVGIGTTSDTTMISEESSLSRVEKPEDEAKKFSGEFNAVTADTTAESSTPPDTTILHAGAPGNVDWDKKIIKTARVTLELKDYTGFNTVMHDQLKRYGAYIASEQQTESDARIQNSLTIKVPVALFEDLMNSIIGKDIKVLEKNISTDDVTSEVVDTKSRIAAKQQVRDRYMELLKSAKTMKDILAVQNEINGIQEDLESASGRVSYLSHNAAYSTINLMYYQYINGNNADTAGPSFFAEIKDAFTTGGAIITNILLFFISVWPLVLAGGVLLLYVKKGKLKKA